MTPLGSIPMVPTCLTGLAVEQPHSLGTAFGSQTCPPIDFTRLFIVLATSHLFLDSASLDQFSKSSNCLLDGFFFAYLKFDHYEFISPKFMMNFLLDFARCGPIP